MAKNKDESSLDTDKTIEILNTILEMELAGVVRYTHYSLMVFGHARIPIISWMREQAAESLAHANEAGEHVTSLGGHPSLKIGKLLETHRHDMDSILKESLEHEHAGLDQYKKLLDLVRDRRIVLEEYARRLIHDEELHLADVEKMLRKPGNLKPSR